ncbi:hypothetical protein N072000002_09560 [Clostridium tetani]|uniref:Uncharacterized protein n=1 Tax=Clostridium tetani TaxID=1513 RepID=A0ABC8EAW2_CLOTA|nr:hypothetical protein [Clostridium tetani]BDR80700.1 hypothetical protein K234311028_09460 [Clostridium tetani]BDR89155.1 hypothetical protein N072000002_09560 [Clostridium tetani]
MERSSFFNAILDQNGNPDRCYLAEDFARYFATFIGNGIFPNPADQLQVIAIDNSMQIRIKSGKAWINGYFYENTDDYILTLDVADGVLSRIDRVVLKLDFINREIRIKVKKGDYASNAVAKTLQRDADAYELALADIKVSAGAIKITQADITDLRLNKSMCGIVHGTVEQVDTTAIFNQFESWYSTTKENYDRDISTWTKEKKQAFDNWYNTNIQAFMDKFNKWYGDNTNKWEKDFNNWFELIKGQLNGDIAAKLTAKTIELEKKNDELEDKINNIEVPVKSVNNKTGNVELKAIDIKTNSGENVEIELKSIRSDLKNNMHTNIYDKNQNGKVDIAEVAESVDWGNIKNKPDLNGKVTSVNGQTGAVTLYSSGIKYRYQSYDSIYDVIEGVKKDIKNIDLSADKVKVNNSNLNSKDVNSALTELFTFADNGKKNWVDVIGSPLSTGDSFSTLKSKTQILKNTMASNLSSKKVSASGTESLNSLINKIKNINVGKKFATGTRTSTMSPNLGTISDLNFRPSTVIWYGTLYESSRVYMNYMSVLIDGYISFNAAESDDWTTHIDKETVIRTSSNGFSINPKYSYYNKEITWRWYAFE